MAELSSWALRVPAVRRALFDRRPLLEVIQ
jgi:hypothetical protein